MTSAETAGEEARRAPPRRTRGAGRRSRSRRASLGSHVSFTAVPRTPTTSAESFLPRPRPPPVAAAGNGAVPEDEVRRPAPPAGPSAIRTPARAAVESPPWRCRSSSPTTTASTPPASRCCGGRSRVWARSHDRPRPQHQRGGPGHHHRPRAARSRRTFGDGWDGLACDGTPVGLRAQRAARPRASPCPTSSSPASTPAATWAPTSPTPAPSAPPSRRRCGAARPSPSRWSREPGWLDEAEPVLAPMVEHVIERGLPGTASSTSICRTGRSRRSRASAPRGSAAPAATTTSSWRAPTAADRGSTSCPATSASASGSTPTSTWSPPAPWP